MTSHLEIKMHKVVAVDTAQSLDQLPDTVSGLGLWPLAAGDHMVQEVTSLDAAQGSRLYTMLCNIHFQILFITIINNQSIEKCPSFLGIVDTDPM